MDKQKWVAGLVVFTIVLGVAMPLGAQLPIPTKFSKDYSKITKIAKMCIDSIQLTDEEGNLVENIDPVVKDPFCCSMYFGDKSERLHCLVTKKIEINNFHEWLYDNIHKAINDTMSGVCITSKTWPAFPACWGFPGTAGGGITDEDIKKGIESVKEGLKCLKIVIDGYILDDLKFIQECSKKTQPD